MSLVRQCSGAAVAAALFAISTTAHAQDPLEGMCAKAPKEAQVLRDAARLLEAREVLKACASGCVSHLETLKVCTDLLTQVHNSIPSITIDARDGRGSSIIDGRVLIDGVELRAQTSGTRVDVDPGPHTVRFIREDGSFRDKTSIAKTGEKDQVVRIEFAIEQPRSKPLVPKPVELPETATTDQVDDNGWSGLKMAGVGVGAVGVVALGLGVGFAVDADAKNTDSQALCDGNTLPNECTRDGKCLRDDAFTSAGVSTAAFVIGGLAVAGGVAMFVLAPAEGRQARIVLRPGVVALTGNW